MKFSPGNAQATGAREEQEDSFGFSDPDDHELVAHGGVAAVVADGMGGFENGGAASKTAVEVFLQAYAGKAPSESIPDALICAVQQANEAVAALSKDSGSVRANTGTTLAAIVMHEEWLYWISAGDSRVYLFRDQRIVRLTADHVYAAILERDVSLGKITREQAMHHPERGSLTSYLGLQSLPRLDRSLRAFPLQAGDFALICTDGLYRTLADDEIAAALGRDAHKACEALVEAALAKGNPHQDNVTVVALKCDEDDDRQSSHELVKFGAVGAALAAVVSGFALWRVAVPQVSFAVDKAVVAPGQSAKLTWNVRHGRVTISAVANDVAPSGTLAINPQGTTKYTLIAQGLLGKVTRTITVNVAAPSAQPVERSAGAPQRVEIESFKGSPLIANSGDTVTLSWAVTGPATVRLDDTQVELSGSKQVKNIDKSRTFTLTTSDPGGHVEKKQIVITPAAPIIRKFEATPASVERGQPVTISWTVGNRADSVVIAPDVGPGPLKWQGSRQVTPEATTTYELNAKGPGGTTTQKLVVTVKPPPTDQ